MAQTVAVKGLERIAKITMDDISHCQETRTGGLDGQGRDSNGGRLAWT